MVSETITVNLTEDAEARPVAVLVQKASQFDSKVFIQSGDKKINAKSMVRRSLYPQREQMRKVPLRIYRLI